mmetsp:Transcript_8554/g.11224  ORF Transcript_8554/g.11224 Transcript_8554/m.11224 type:complete len:413 (-) Transcript_8554:130-1368(-)
MVEKQASEESGVKKTSGKAKKNKTVDLNEKLPNAKYSWLTRICKLFIGGDCISHFVGFVSQKKKDKTDMISVLRFLGDVRRITNKVTRREELLPVTKLSVKLSRLQDQLKSGHEIPFMMKLKTLRYDSSDHVVSKKQNRMSSLKTLPEDAEEIVTLDDLNNLSYDESIAEVKDGPDKGSVQGSTRSKRWRHTRSRKDRESSLSELTTAIHSTSRASNSVQKTPREVVMDAATREKSLRRGRNLSDANTAEIAALDLGKDDEAKLLRKMRISRHNRQIIEQIHRGEHYEDLVAHEVALLQERQWKIDRKKANHVLQKTATLLNLEQEENRGENSSSPQSQKVAGTTESVQSEKQQQQPQNNSTGEAKTQSDIYINTAFPIFGEAPRKSGRQRAKPAHVMRLDEETKAFSNFVI